MSALAGPWTAETLLAAAVDRGRDRITAAAGGVRIDGRAASDSELRLLVELTRSGLIDLNTLDTPEGARCARPTRAGHKQHRRWRHLVGSAG